MRVRRTMTLLARLFTVLGIGSAASIAAAAAPINPHIDMDAYLKVAAEAARYRERRRVTEEQFLALARQPGTIILDARSAEKFALLHIEGAINISFPDISIESLAERLPDKKVRILIYCNNNFTQRDDAFPPKRVDASLNVSTFISLYSYGYRNIYELGPLLDATRTRLPLVKTPPAAH